MTSRRDAAACTDEQTYVTDRIQRVLSWFGYSGNPAQCEDPLVNVDVPIQTQDPFVTNLGSAHPNPFHGNGSVEVHFSIASRGLTVLEMFDVNGRLVRTLQQSVLDPGPHRLTWDGKDNQGQLVASGVYFYRLNSGDETWAKKLVVVRGGS